MLHERGVIAGVSHIRLQDVLKRAGLTTGAAYRLWTDQEEFHRELAVAATRWRDDVPINQTISAIRPVVDAHASLADVIRVATAAQIDGMADRVESSGRRSTTFLTTLALRATAGHSQELRAASNARHRESVDSFLELYAGLMQAYGRRMREPFTVRHFATAMAALGEGFALQAIEGEPHPTVVLADPDTGATNEWTLFGAAVEGLVAAFTEPDPRAATVRDK